MKEQIKQALIKVIIVKHKAICKYSKTSPDFLIH